MSKSNTRKRNLPSWMSSIDDEENDDIEKTKQPKDQGKSNKDQNESNLEKQKSASGTSSASSDFSKLMEGIVFVLSGFVNPERGVLRSQMLEMGAEYQQDWNSNSTLLVCAFSNTPKFRQVKSDGGTIISKDWITECYTQRKLIDIEPYLLHAGKPWRRQSISHDAQEDEKPSTSSKSLKQEEKSFHPKKTTGKSLKQEEKRSHPNKTTGSSKVKSIFSPSKVKKWAIEDLKRTISWLENQDEKPEPGETNKIAAEGILTCLQDAIDAFKQGQGIQQITEQWACVPRVVDELAKSNAKVEDLSLEAMACKQIYELEFLNMEHNEFTSKKNGKKKENVNRDDDQSYDSDATIEMTEEEIDRAYNSIACSL